MHVLLMEDWSVRVPLYDHEASRIVAPLSRGGIEQSSRMRPLVRRDGAEFVVVMRLLSILPVRVLREPVRSIAVWRDEMVRALDWIFCWI